MNCICGQTLADPHLCSVKTVVLVGGIVHSYSDTTEGWTFTQRPRREECVVCGACHPVLARIWENDEDEAAFGGLA